MIPPSLWHGCHVADDATAFAKFAPRFASAAGLARGRFPRGRCDIGATSVAAQWRSGAVGLLRDLHPAGRLAGLVEAEQILNEAATARRFAPIKVELGFQSLLHVRG